MITRSMRRAIDETERRRAVQEAHNALNRIEPRPIRSQASGGGSRMLEMIEEAKRRREGLTEVGAGHQADLADEVHADRGHETGEGANLDPALARSPASASGSRRGGLYDQLATRARPSWLSEAEQELEAERAAASAQASIAAQQRVSRSINNTSAWDDFAP